MYDYTGHDCNSPLGVVVHQDDGEAVRLPIVDDGIQLHERKVGPTSITRRAEVTVPIEGVGSDNWLQYINAFQPSAIREGTDQLISGSPSSGNVESGVPKGIQQADIIGQPVTGDPNGQLDPVGDPVVLFRGYVASVGSREGVNRARFRIYDPMKFLSQIEAGVSFTAPTIRDVLRYLSEEYTSEQPIFDDVSIETDPAAVRPTQRNLDNLGKLQLFLSYVSPLVSAPSPGTGKPISKRHWPFSTNRDTLKDVLKMVLENSDVNVWFQPSGKRGLSLCAVGDVSTRYDLTPSADTYPKVITNNALYEMRPFNGLKLKGATGKRVGISSLTANVPIGDSYPEATAVYPPLVERYGGELTTTEGTDLTETETIEDAAVSQLKDALDDVSGGEMVTTLAPMIRPFDRVEATPACSGVTADVDPLTYEVQEVTHSLVPGDNNVPRTKIAVSMGIDESEIEVRSTIRDAQTGGEPTSNNPADDLDLTFSVP